VPVVSELKIVNDPEALEALKCRLLDLIEHDDLVRDVLRRVLHEEATRSRRN
jgi:hypothetical protein